MVWPTLGSRTAKEQNRTDLCFLLLCTWVVYCRCIRFSFFSTMPRDSLRSTSPKWPISCRVGRKNLNSINWPYLGQPYIGQIHESRSYVKVPGCRRKMLQMWSMQPRARASGNAGLCSDDDDDDNFRLEFPPDVASVEDRAARSRQSSAAPSWWAAAARGSRTGRTSRRPWRSRDKRASTWGDRGKCRRWPSRSVADSRATSPPPPPDYTHAGNELVSWSLTSLFSTNMAISETKRTPTTTSL